MLAKHFFLLFLGCMALIPTSSFGSDTVTITINKQAFEEYQRLMAVFDNDPLKVDRIPSEFNHRSTIDAIILTKALKLGGLDSPPEFIPVTNARRETEEVAAGRAVMAAHQLNYRTVDVPEYKNVFYMSAPIARHGEFVKGFFCLQTNEQLLQATSAQDINRMTGIIGQHWDNDAAVLKDMGITNVIRAPTIESMVKMVSAGRADWIPLEFPDNDRLEITLFAYRLVPVPGIKFSLIESRHFLVSKKHPLGKKAFEALQKGIKGLRKKGFIEQALIAAGFFNPRTKSWKTLNQDALDQGRPAAKE
ncbi:hypothetical protein GKC30_06885 [Pseudodesulfovibrio sp. F-1]|uniref:Solute-binding protein family 3/N-terminal domain-containing protein n=1 Tax=Pseudodesulfovibrio alkaliphilus TaxID=2661613 RepID=A0A7K1KMP1_9BACT|nr:hypothetical protein [Pseudodesulfovibrio alkaliphilus]MUM77353.1 hypothetical protein [Pseudodesulfovibrio alkaliphilus]